MPIWTRYALLLLVVLFAAGSAEAQPNCAAYSNANLMTWPDDAPVWELCWRRPSESTPTPNGSGLEILDVWYNGHKVMERGHVPILNVEYGPGGCGCFRDWMDSEVRFEAIGETGCVDGYCEATQAPRTVCDCAPENSCDLNQNNECNQDVGSFKGVAAEKLGDRLILTTQASAGWYRYLMKWTFYRDGRIEPRFGFATVPAGCVANNHFHHTYYRFDFDIDDGGGDNVRFVTDLMPPAILFLEETSGRADEIRDWEIVDSTSQRGYKVVAGPQDHELFAPNWDPEPFSVADYWALAYDPNEIDDPGFGCEANLNDLVDGESVADADIVFWYRAGVYHEGGANCVCDRVGPVLEPVGDWTPPTAGPKPRPVLKGDATGMSDSAPATFKGDAR